MDVAIVYESLFGNTREIAEAIAEGIAEAGPRADVACCRTAEAGPELPRADLLIAGAPTWKSRAMVGSAVASTVASICSMKIAHATISEVMR